MRNGNNILVKGGSILLSIGLLAGCGAKPEPERVSNERISPENLAVENLD